MARTDLEDYPTVDECAEAAGKLLMMFDVYSQWLERNTPPVEVGKQLRKLVPAIEATWDRVNRIQRDDEIKILRELLVYFYKEWDVDEGVPESLKADLASY